MGDAYLAESVLWGFLPRVFSASVSPTSSMIEQATRGQRPLGKPQGGKRQRVPDGRIGTIVQLLSLWASLKKVFPPGSCTRLEALGIPGVGVCSEPRLYQGLPSWPRSC